MDMADGVAARVAALCLDSHGRLSDRLLHDDAVRGALVLDLVLAERVAMTDESVVVDGTPTGFPPADRLLAAIGAESERSLDEWLGERRIGLADVTAVLVASGRWSVVRRLLRGRRYVDSRPAETARDLARRPTDWSADWTPEDCCVTAVAAAAGLLNREYGTRDDVPPSLLQATGVEWAASAVVDHLRDAASRYLTERSALGSGLGF